MLNEVMSNIQRIIESRFIIHACRILDHLEMTQKETCLFHIKNDPRQDSFKASQMVQWQKKISSANAGDSGDMGTISGCGRSFGEGNRNPLQYSCLEIPQTEEPGVCIESMGSQRVRHLNANTRVVPREVNSVAKICDIIMGPISFHLSACHL